MSQPSPPQGPPSPQGILPPLTDSPWFWAMLFGAVGVLLLVAMLPRYGKRQHRLEMQYHARQEIARRQVEGTVAAREPGEEGAAPPPVAGDLIIPLGPLLALFTGLFAISATFLWRSRRPGAVPAHPPR